MSSFFRKIFGRVKFVKAENHINIPTDMLKPLAYGETVPDFEITMVNGECVKLCDLLDESPVVISFFRGAWCPSCNLELNALEEEMAEFEINKIKLIGVSPETIDKTLALKEEKKISFNLVSDPENKIASIFDIVVPLKDALPPFSKNIVEKYIGKSVDGLFVPIPATYIIDRKGRVLLSFVDYDFTKRVKPSELLSLITA